MENRLKLKISKLFQSCRSKNIYDVSDQPFCFPENRHHRQLIELFSPKPQPSCKPKWHFENQPETLLPGPKISHKTTAFPAETDCRRPKKTSKNNRKKKPHYRKPKKIDDFSSITDNYYYDWCCSDEEDESDDETTLFSSRSLSSDSSESFRKNRASRKTQKKPKRTGAGGGRCRNLKATEVTPLENRGKLVTDSFAVVKKSSDPHEDFRVSMVEMIVEKEIFGAEDLENLLKCFISLNSEEHHGVIFDVFMEIWEALFEDMF